MRHAAFPLARRGPSTREATLLSSPGDRSPSVIVIPSCRRLPKRARVPRILLGRYPARSASASRRRSTSRRAPRHNRSHPRGPSWPLPPSARSPATPARRPGADANRTTRGQQVTVSGQSDHRPFVPAFLASHRPRVRPSFWPKTGGEVRSRGVRGARECRGFSCRSRKFDPVGFAL